MSDAEVRQAPRWRLAELPYLEQAHYELAQRAYSWTQRPKHNHAGLAEECRAIALELGEAGLLDYVIPTEPVLRSTSAPSASSARR